jgi:hypothetical protein
MVINLYEPTAPILRVAPVFTASSGPAAAQGAASERQNARTGSGSDGSSPEDASRNMRRDGAEKPTGRREARHRAARGAYRVSGDLTGRTSPRQPHPHPDLKLRFSRLTGDLGVL